jgi:AcrR family transcriptional regulator
VKQAKSTTKPKPRRTQQERREATIRKLLDATIESLLAVGYSRTTVKEICKRSGVSHGGLFRFFPSLLDLIVATAEECARRQIASFEQQFAHLKHDENPLIAALHLLRSACRSSLNTVSYELLLAARTDAKLRRALQKPAKRYLDAIRATAENIPGLDAIPAETREVLLFTAINTFDGETLMRTVLPQPELEEKKMELLIGLLGLSR